MSRTSTRGLGRRLDRAAARATAQRTKAQPRSIIGMSEQEIAALAKTMTRAEFSRLSTAERERFQGYRVDGALIAQIGVFEGPGHPGITQREFHAALGFRPSHGDIVIAFWKLPHCYRLRKGPGAPDDRPETDDEPMFELDPAYPAPTPDNPDPDPYPEPPFAPAEAAPQTEPPNADQAAGLAAADVGTPDTEQWGRASKVVAHFL